MAKVIEIKKERTVSVNFQSATISLTLVPGEGETVSTVSKQADLVLDAEVAKLLDDLVKQSELVENKKASIIRTKEEEERARLNRLPKTKEEAVELKDDEGVKVSTYPYVKLEELSNSNDMNNPVVVAAKLITNKLGNYNTNTVAPNQNYSNSNAGGNQLSILLAFPIEGRPIKINNAKDKNNPIFSEANDRELEFIANKFKNATENDRVRAREIIRLKALK